MRKQIARERAVGTFNPAAAEPLGGPAAPPAVLSAKGHSFSAINVVADRGSVGGEHLPDEVSTPGDPFEIEADRAAAQADAGASVGAIAKQLTPVSGKRQRATAASGESSGGGDPLDPATRKVMESRFGFDFGRVRIHTDSASSDAARVLEARAFTTGSSITFASGQYAPDRPDGRRLLAHELAHVVQQRHMPVGAAMIQRQPATAAPPAPSPTPDSATPASPGTSAVPNLKVIQPSAGKAVVRHTGTGVTFTDDVEYVRFQLEEYVNKNGLDSIKRFEAADELFTIGMSPISLNTAADTPPDADGEYLKRVKKLVHEEIVALRVHIANFRDDFQRRANDSLNTVLDESKTRVEKELDRYGIKENRTTVLGVNVWTSYSGDPVGTKKLADDARALQAKLGPVVSAKHALDDVSKTSTKDDYRFRQAIWEGPHQKYTAALKEYDELRKKLEDANPMTIAFNLDPLNPATVGHLAKLASETGSDRTEHIGAELSDKLKNIEKVRKKAGEDKNYVWSLERIVGLTQQLPDIKNHRDLKHAGLRSSVVIEKVAEIEAKDALVAVGTGIVLFGLGLIAAAPTGGMSLAAAGAVSAAGTAEAVLTIASAYNAYQKFSLDSAANATDYDNAKVISEEAPNLFWLALDLVGAAKAVKGGLKAAAGVFRTINLLREEALTAKAMSMAAEARGIAGQKAQYEKALAELESTADEAKAGAGKRLRQEVEQDAGGKGRGSSAVDPDAEPPTLRTPLLSDANLGADSRGLSRVDAVNEYFRLIQDNPDREYAIIQHAQTKRFGVVTGSIDNVKVPPHLGDDWSFVRHYHPNLTTDEAGKLVPIPRDSKKGMFGARMPSVFGPSQGPGDVLGARISSIERGNAQVSETVDWFEPETNRMRTSRYGYNPKDVDKPYWIEITTRSETTLKGKFASGKEAKLWIMSIDEFRPPRAPVGAH